MDKSCLTCELRSCMCCSKDLARTAWTGNPAMRCEVRGSAYK
ncbi:hypothetical protein F383_26020 [Gossypium arboreum]|uniref:Uncharacterized protein n=1 Tax=Gossypium arboreum TaxID=29729 RepID=A0A0B0P9C0_GOSAR|nr:hypothetical protein F383_05673 [Gossypium arboreum]KHG19941.1 hypothetical protein F383_26020 [Gossypium arboreum]